MDIFNELSCSVVSTTLKTPWVKCGCKRYTFLDSGKKNHIHFWRNDYFSLLQIWFQHSYQFCDPNRDLVLPLTVQDLLRSCVFVNIYGCKREPLVRTICPRSRTPSFNLPLTLVNGISCCFPDGAGMNATWKESVKSGLVGTQDFATCLY